MAKQENSGCLSAWLKGAKIVRVATIPPVMAVALVVILRLTRHAFVGASLWLTILGLAVVPCIGYPICAFIPKLKANQRKNERTAAVIGSVIGYVGAVVACLLLNTRGVELLVCATYLGSGVVLAAVQMLTGLHVSGHACGVSGPISVAAVTVSAWFLLGYLLLIPVVVSSLALKRHSAWELAIGTAVPVIIMGILLWIL